MALKVLDRVQETTTTTGTGTVTLGGAVSGFQSFFNAGLNNGDTTYYCITSGTAWEVGLGTFSTGPNAIARTTILASSAFGTAITLAGTSNVFCVYPASKAVYEQNDGSVGIGTNTPLTSILSGTAITVEVQNTDPLSIGTNNAMFRAYDSFNSVDCCMIGAGGTVNAGVVGTFSGFPLAFYVDSAEAMRITTTGRVGIGTTTPSQPLDVNGTVKATTFSGAGAFTTLSASSTVSGIGFSNYLASPPAIGGTTAAAGTFTTLVANTSVGIGSLPVAGSNFLNAKNITGATTATANYTIATVQSDVTVVARGYTSLLATAAASFTTSLQHFYANQSTIGAGSTVSTQFGFISESNLIGATNNYAFIAGNTAAVTAGKTAYGFYSAVNTATVAGANTYGFYAAGTAPNVFVGTVNIGSLPAAGINFFNAKNITGATTANACAVAAVVQSDVTSVARGYTSVIATAAASFSTAIQHFFASQATIGAGSAVTQQVGFLSESNLIGATNNYGFVAGDTAAVTAGKAAYGFYSDVNTPTGGGTTWGFYANGTANNLFRGNTYFGNTAVTPTAKIHVAAGSATASTAPLKFTAGTNLTTAEAGTMEYDGENLYFSGEASQRGVVAASQFVILTSDYTTPLGTANVLKQAFNATTNGTLTLTLGSYLFECLLNLSSLSTTSGTIAFGFGGTALGRFRYLATANKAAATTTAANTTFSQAATATIITPATTSTVGYALVQGSIVITTAGTIIPSIALSVAAANVVVTGSYFNLTPIGSSTVQTVGNWS